MPKILTPTTLGESVLRRAMCSMTRRNQAFTRSRASSRSSSVASLGPLPHVVILGAGYAGCLLAKGLEQAIREGVIRMTIVDKKEFMFHKIAGFRAATTGDATWINQTTIPLDEIVRYGRIVVGTVREITETTKQLWFDGDEHPPLAYDILVVATGIAHLSPAELPAGIRTIAECSQHFQGLANALKESGSVHIIGTGPSALELAGEIRQKYPLKPITLVSASAQIMASTVSPVSNRFRRRTVSRLKDLNISVLHRERVVVPSASEVAAWKVKYQTNAPISTRGERNLSVTCELLIWASPCPPQASILPAHWLNELGEANVDASFLVKAQTDVFALGDISSVPETKSAVSLPAKVLVIVDNIRKLASAMGAAQRKPTLDQALQSLSQYRFRDGSATYLCLGSARGVTQLPIGIVLGDRFTARWKGRDLYTDKFCRLLTGKSFAMLGGSAVPKSPSRPLLAAEGNPRGNKETDAQSLDRNPSDLFQLQIV